MGTFLYIFQTFGCFNRLVFGNNLQPEILSVCLVSTRNLTKLNPLNIIHYFLPQFHCKGHPVILYQQHYDPKPLEAEMKQYKK